MYVHPLLVAAQTGSTAALWIRACKPQTPASSAVARECFVKMAYQAISERLLRAEKEHNKSADEDKGEEEGGYATAEKNQDEVINVLCPDSPRCFAQGHVDVVNLRICAKRAADKGKPTR
jgi:hypothetical protein